MKWVQATSRNRAFNLIELVAVLAIIGIIAATFLQPKKVIPRDRRDRGRDGGGGFPNRCAYNQKLITDAFLSAARDRDDQFLWVPTPDAKEPVGNGQIASQLQSISNYFTDITILICPSDRTRWSARDFGMLTDTNVSYFMNADSRKGSNAAYNILIGDRHLQAGTNAVTAGVFVYTNGMAMGWTTELHSRWRGGGPSPIGPAGTLAFADGHAERFPAALTNLAAVFSRQNLDTARLLVP